MARVIGLCFCYFLCLSEILCLLLFRRRWNMATPSMETPACLDTPAARDAVFQTHELLEAILLQLPSKEILLNCQRTCQNFRDVVPCSVRLQRALFFRPKGSIAKDKPKPLEAIALNPMLCTAFDPWINDVKTSCACYYLDHENTDLPHTTRNAWQTAKGDLSDKFSRKEASWRQMLISQPPITKLQIYHRKFQIYAYEESPNMDLWAVRRTVDDQDRQMLHFVGGIKMGTLTDLVQ